MVGWHHRLNGHGFGWTLEVVMDREAWYAVVPPAKARDLGLMPGLRGSPGEGNGNALQYSFLKNPVDRGAWWATVHGVVKSQTQLSNYHFPLLYLVLSTTI